MDELEVMDLETQTQEVETEQPEQINEADSENVEQETEGKNQNENSTKELEMPSDDFIYQLALKVEKSDYTPNEEEQELLDMWLEAGNELDPDKLNELEEQPEDLEKEATEKAQENSLSKDDLELLKKELGAKSESDILSLVKELKASRDRTGSKLGNELKIERERVKAQEQFIKDFAQGKPEAIKWAKENGIINENQSNRNMDFDDDDYDNEFLDPVAERHNKALREELEELKRELGKQKEAESSKVFESQMNSTLTELWATFKDLAPTGNIKESLSLFRDFRAGNEGDPIDPRLEKTIELLQFASERNLSSLEDAYFLKNKGNIKKQLIEAEERGRASVLNRNQKTVGLANNRGSNGADTITEKYISDLENGRVEMPDGWLDENDRPTDKMPLKVKSRLRAQGYPF